MASCSRQTAWLERFLPESSRDGAIIHESESKVVLLGALDDGRVKVPRATAWDFYPPRVSYVSSWS